MTNKIEFTCYHITNMDSAQKIITSNKFKPKFSDKHYLGQGNYFFKDEEIAIENIERNSIIKDNNTSNSRICLSAAISVDECNYLDLDCYDSNKKFRQYVSEISQELKDNNIKLSFTTKKDYGKNSFRYIVCYFLDSYKKEFNFFVIKRTYFSRKDNLFHEDLKFNPMPYHEAYICVSNDKCIRDIKLNNNTYNIDEGGSYV